MNTKKTGNKYRIYIDEQGNWFQDGIKITHQWTYLHNNKHLDVNERGEYFVDEGTGRVYVKVADTPFFITMVDKRKDGFYIRLNDETEEKLDTDKLWFNKRNILYTKVKNSKFPAKFLRPAYYELMKYLKEENDGYYISDGKKEIKLPKQKTPKTN